MKNGRTLYICWGDSGGFQFECSKYIFRICLWKISFSYVRVDIEKLIDYASELAVEVKVKYKEHMCDDHAYVGDEPCGNCENNDKAAFGDKNEF